VPYFGITFVSCFCGRVLALLRLAAAAPSRQPQASSPKHDSKQKPNVSGVRPLCRYDLLKAVRTRQTKPLENNA